MEIFQGAKQLTIYAKYHKAQIRIQGSPQFVLQKC